MQNLENKEVMVFADNSTADAGAEEKLSAMEEKVTEEKAAEEKATEERVMGEKVQYAGFFVRLSAYCIDSLIVGMLLLAVRIPMLIEWLSRMEGPLDKQILFEFSAWDIILYLLGCLYYILLTYYSGATVGKKLMRIKVISANGDKLPFMDVLYRETIGRFLCVVVMNMGYILIGIDREKRGFHDMLSDTRVVYNLEEGKGESETRTETGQRTKKKARATFQPSNYGYVARNQKNMSVSDKTGEGAIETKMPEEKTEEKPVDKADIGSLPDVDKPEVK